MGGYKLPSILASPREEKRKKPERAGTRPAVDRFGLTPEDYRNMRGQATRSNAVFEARAVLMDQYPRKFPDEESVQVFLSDTDPNHRIVRQYNRLLRQFGWQPPEI